MVETDELNRDDCKLNRNNQLRPNVGNSYKEWGYRHQQCLLLFFALTVAFGQKSCMGVVLVAMTNYNNIGNERSPNIISKFNETTKVRIEIWEKNVNINNATENVGVGERGDFKVDGFWSALLLTPPYPIFGWSKKQQDTIQSSFFWGYTVMQIPCGQLIHRFGSRRVLSTALMMCGIINLFLPLGAYYFGWICAAISRLILGVCQAGTLPALHAFFGKWTHKEERGKLMAFVCGGNALGPVSGIFISGFIAASPLGWPGIFRIYAVLSCLIALVLWYLLADSPAQHPKISAKEKRYIEEDLGQADVTVGRRKVPWLSILRHRGMWAIIVAHSGHVYGKVTLYSEVPAYMDKVMNVNIKSNGILTALPFLAMWLSGFFFAWMWDLLIAKKIFSVVVSRKLANTLGDLCATVGLITLGFMSRNIYVVEAILILVCGFNSSPHLGFYLNHVDISPNYAGVMMSISNFFSNIGGSMSPIFASFILSKDVASPDLWRKVFVTTAGVYFVTDLIYVILGTSDRADWDDVPQKGRGQNDAQETDHML